MSEGNLPKAYAFHEVEPRWYAYWEQGGFFHAGLDGAKLTFSQHRLAGWMPQLTRDLSGRITSASVVEE